MIQKTDNEIKSEFKFPSMPELIEAGVHFGHKTSHWHPKMEPYLFSARNDVHVFDLEKTVKKLEEALAFMRRVLAGGGEIVLVGTKPAAKALIKDAGQKLALPYVAEHWLGGTLTNFKTVNKRIKFLKELEDDEQSGAWDKFTKKERLQLKAKKEKLQRQLAGIRNMTRLPGGVFVADVKVDNLAVREAKKLKIPVIAICDSDNNPALADYVIPANDDASSALKIIFDTIVANLENAKPVSPIVEKTSPEAVKND